MTQTNIKKKTPINIVSKITNLARAHYASFMHTRC
nr:MAG TPA: hypothetical protein [Microviridae sp.]